MKKSDRKGVKIDRKEKFYVNPSLWNLCQNCKGRGVPWRFGSPCVYCEFLSGTSIVEKDGARLVEANRLLIWRDLN